MNKEKLNVVNNLFEGKQIRSIWDTEKEDYYFSIVDVVLALTDTKRPRKYWNDLKIKLIVEGSELSEKIGQLKLKSQDGKFYNTDVLDTEGIFRLIESIPSKKAEPFKLWLAHLGKERIDEIFDPELAVNRAINYYRSKGYSDDWIKIRLDGILSRKKLTDLWKENGIQNNYEYAILTNEIYETWSGMSAQEYKTYKNIRKESLRDNMTDIEVVLTDLGEITTRDIVKKEKPQGLKQNLKVARRGGNVSKIAKEHYEKETGVNASSNKNIINKN